MATMKATALREALSKARQVGRIEESVTIAGCDLVMQNLVPDDYEAIVAETAELEDVEYFHAYQIGHVCRAIIEIDGQDLRDVQYIEDEVPDPKDPTKIVVRNFERHEWVRDNLIATWGREAIVVCWRKFAELLVEAEKKAKEGIEFLVPDEDAETKLRRIANELSEAEEDLPEELISKVLKESGYIKASNTAELDRVAERVNKFAELDAKVDAIAGNETAPAAVAPAAPQEAYRRVTDPVPTTPQQPAAPTAPAPKISRPSPTGDPREMMRSRQRLNQGATTPHVPTPATSGPAVVRAARPAAQVPDAIRQAAFQNTEAVKPGSAIPHQGRAAQIANLEGAVDPSLAGVANMALPTRPEEAREVLPQGGLDPRAIAAITEQPPAVGFNKNYKPPPRQP